MAEHELAVVPRPAGITPVPGGVSPLRLVLRADEQQTSRRAKRAWKESVTTTIIKKGKVLAVERWTPGPSPED